MGYLQHWNGPALCRYCPKENRKPCVGQVGLIYHDHCTEHAAKWKADRDAMEALRAERQAMQPAYKFPWHN